MRSNTEDSEDWVGAPASGCMKSGLTGESLGLQVRAHSTPGGKASLGSSPGSVTSGLKCWASLVTL